MAPRTPSGLTQHARLSHYLHGFGSLMVLTLLTPMAPAFASQPSAPRSLEALPTITTTIQLKKPSSAPVEPTPVEPTPVEPTEADALERRSHLFDLNGNTLGDFLGDFQDITPDGQLVITYDLSAAQGSDREATPTHLYRPDGVEVANLKGAFLGFTANGQLIMTYAQGQSYLYDLSGTEQAVLDGLIRWSTSEGQTFITDAGNQRQFNLYSADGTLQLAFEENFQGFTPDSPKLITTDGQRSALYTVEGDLEAIFEGVFIAFSPDGQTLVTVSDEDATQSHLYTLDGKLQATFDGEFAAFSPRGNALITAALITDITEPDTTEPGTTEPGTTETYQAWLYSLEGLVQASFKGFFITFAPNGQSLFTYFNEGSHLYDFEGNQHAIFAGKLMGMTSDSQTVVTASPVDRQSWLYDFGGTKLATLDGLFVGFLSDERRIVTSEAGAEGLLRLSHTPYYLYTREGELQRTLEGQLLGLTARGDQGLVLYANGKSRVYSGFDGAQQATFDGRVVGFTQDEQGVFINGAR